ncbi:Enolase 1 [Hordeum vulgare]|nr:Enolase 1 [Hordeum vulgare]
MEAEYPPNWSITDAIQKLRANAILAVSLAVCKAGAMVNKIPLYQHIANLTGNKTLVLPVPSFNVINHEFMILPTGAASFKEAMKMGVEVYHHVKSIIKKKYGQDATNVGDEGGFAPNIQENKEGLELLKVAIAKAGYTGKVVIGMDVAASEFYSEKDQTYALNSKEDRVAKAISEKTCNALLLKLPRKAQGLAFLPHVESLSLAFLESPVIAMASSSLPPRLANNPPSFHMESSSLLPPSLYTIEQAMVAVRSALACQESSVAMELQSHSCHTSTESLQIQFAFSLNPEAANMVEEGKVLMELRLLASYNMVNPEAEDIVEEGKVLMEG